MASKAEARRGIPVNTHASARVLGYWVLYLTVAAVVYLLAIAPAVEVTSGEITAILAHQPPVVTWIVVFALALLITAFVLLRTSRVFSVQSSLLLLGLAIIAGVGMSVGVTEGPLSYSILGSLFALLVAAWVLVRLRKNDLEAESGHTILDMFDREVEAKRLAKYVLPQLSSGPSAVLSIEGPWGSGKSTFIEYFKCALQSEVSGGCCLVSINPTDFQSPEHAWRNLAEKLEVAIDNRAVRFRNALMQFPQPLAELIGRAFGNSTLLDWTGWEKAVLRSSDAPEIHNYVRRQLGEKQLVVFVDDLDRLASDEAVKVLVVLNQHIRTVADLLVLGLDRSRILSHLKAELGENAGEYDAQSYLEKLVDIQHPLRQPPSSSLYKYFRRCISRASNGQCIDEVVVEAFRDVSEWLPSQPRALERLATRVAKSLTVYFGRESSEFFHADFFAALTLLAFRFPQFHRTLCLDRSVLTDWIWLREKRKDIEQVVRTKISELEIPAPMRDVAFKLFEKVGDNSFSLTKWDDYSLLNSGEEPAVTIKELRTIFDSWAVAPSAMDFLRVIDDLRHVTRKETGEICSALLHRASEQIHDVFSRAVEQRAGDEINKDLDEVRRWREFFDDVLAWIERSFPRSTPLRSSDFAAIWRNFSSFRNFTGADPNYDAVRRWEEDAIPRLIVFLDDANALITAAEIWRATSGGIGPEDVEFRRNVLVLLFRSRVFPVIKRLVSTGQVSSDWSHSSLPQDGMFLRSLLLEIPRKHRVDELPLLRDELPGVLRSAFGACPNRSLVQSLVLNYFSALVSNQSGDVLCDIAWMSVFWENFIDAKPNPRWMGSYGRKLKDQTKSCAVAVNFPDWFDKELERIEKTRRDPDG